jgi:phage shock protein PspC (stress-responsive transcriptional regulator)
MNEIKKVHLDRQQFTISVEAYKALDAYLKAIEKQPGVQSEVVREVEVRMAELLAERGVTAEKVILQEDVDYLKQQLGEPRDFKDEDDAGAEEADKTEDEAPRQLYRDTENGMIAGVAAGLAAYFRIDVLIIRLLFVVTTFAGAAGIVLYILLWVLAPEAKTSSDKLKMRGRAVTVDSIKAAVERADLPGTTKRASKTAGAAVRKLTSGFGKLISGAVGLVITIGGAGIILFSMLTGGILITQGFRAVDERIFPYGFSEYLTLGAAIITCVLIGLALMLSGLTLIRRKAVVPGWMVACMAGLFFVSVSVGGVLANVHLSKVVKRYKDAHHTYTQELPAFQQVKLEGWDTDFIFKPSTEYSLDVSLLGKYKQTDLQPKVENGILTVDTTELSKLPCAVLCTGYNDRDLKVTIHAPSLEQVSVKGSDVSFSNDVQLQQQALSVITDDQSDVYLRYARPQSAALTLGKQGGHGKQLIVSGLQPDAGREDIIHLSGYGEQGRIAYADAFTLNTDMTCEGYDPIIALSTMPKQINVSNEPAISGPAFKTKQNLETASFYNCVSLP